jgi:CheY-like chemotaxis protein
MASGGLTGYVKGGAFLAGEGGGMGSAAHARKTILVVEDNDITREGLAVVLRHEGYAVVPARNGREAFDHLAAGSAPDLILPDMLMPVLDGWEFLERFHRQGRQPPVPVVITTGTLVISREWADSHGCAGFLRKPVETAAPLEEVERCPAGRSS